MIFYEDSINIWASKARYTVLSVLHLCTSVNVTACKQYLAFKHTTVLAFIVLCPNKAKEVSAHHIIVLYYAHVLITNACGPDGVYTGPSLNHYDCLPTGECCQWGNSHTGLNWVPICTLQNRIEFP